VVTIDPTHRPPRIARPLVPARCAPRPVAPTRMDLASTVAPTWHHALDISPGEAPPARRLPADQLQPSPVPQVVMVRHLNRPLGE
jgi:hypothetical protein